MSIFLKLKSWQLFLVMLAPVVFMPLIIERDDRLLWFGLIMFLAITLYIGWLYSVGSQINSKLPPELKKNTIIYKLGYIATLSYVAVVAFYVIPMQANSTEYLQMHLNPPLWKTILGNLSTFGMLYGFWFTAKVFVLNEFKREVSPMVYLGPLFLFMLPIIGIWILQPKINEQLLGKNA